MSGQHTASAGDIIYLIVSATPGNHYIIYYLGDKLPSLYDCKRYANGTMVFHWIILSPVFGYIWIISSPSFTNHLQVAQGSHGFASHISRGWLSIEIHPNIELLVSKCLKQAKGIDFWMGGDRESH